MTLTSSSMDGLTAIVAGAGPGVGRACAAALRGQGADVVIAARDAARLETLAAAIEAEPPAGPRVVPLSFDFADLASCQALVDQTLAHFSRIDVLVNVATTGGEHSSIDEGDWGAWRRAFEVNVIGTLELSPLAA